MNPPALRATTSHENAWTDLQALTTYFQGNLRLVFSVQSSVFRGTDFDSNH